MIVVRDQERSESEYSMIVSISSKLGLQLVVALK